jgi:hypothetical protein
MLRRVWKLRDLWNTEVGAASWSDFGLTSGQLACWQLGTCLEGGKVRGSTRALRSGGEQNIYYIWQPITTGGGISERRSPGFGWCRVQGKFG